MDWLECKDKRIVKDISIDEHMINSILKTSKDKIESENLLPLNSTTISSKISLAYDSLRELLEATALKNGFKIYNHECYTPFIKEILKDSNLGDEFDEIRRLRNSINYYGKEISKEECIEIVNNIKNLIKKLNGLQLAK